MLDEISNIHNVILDNRKKAVMSGIKDVTAYDSETINLSTNLGDLTVKGENLKINSFNTDNGNLEIEGKIIALVYVTEKKKGGFLSGLLR